MSSQRRVLLVDDDHLILRTTSRWLRRRGFEVVTASTSEGATATTGPFACAVFDLELPDGSGVDLAERLLADGTVKAVVFFSGSSNASLRERAESLAQLLPKGSSIGELELAIMGAVKHVRPSGIRTARPGLKASGGSKD
jgi:ActR/RegA family two-component response regulator